MNETSNEGGASISGHDDIFVTTRWTMVLPAADREKGKLRAVLISALKHFLAGQWREAPAQKRGCTSGMKLNRGT